MRFPLFFFAFACSVSLRAAAQAPTNYEELYHLQRVDHFSSLTPPSGNLSWSQRYLINATFFDPLVGCILFYTGNEGDVTLYAAHTGLIWENAQRLKALVAFGEHRFYGKSWPLQTEAASLQHMSYLSSQQALADYADLLRHIRLSRGVPPSTPVVSFGGSYGGVLSAMFRAAFPGSVDAAIASSAPLRAFPGQTPPWDTSLYYQVISRDATAAGGSTDACAANVRALWEPLFADGATAAGRAALGAAFRTCKPLQTPDDALALAYFVRGSWDESAMGNYPYPSSACIY
jgi:lysosomal Pro-X carboxypeptidase